MTTLENALALASKVARNPWIAGISTPFQLVHRRVVYCGWEGVVGRLAAVDVVVRVNWFLGPTGRELGWHGLAPGTRAVRTKQVSPDP